ncbi:glycoside hydrolase family protein [Nitrospirillum amazonense]|uniref:glycoside hydrolase family protein n=1 Tax=Nitrospirillum amazonense TaxID=28077 RepID=UPI002DD43F0E|nr:glycoside hydrolase family protein [Nitrospirillum amazonense]MEC4591589.1 glycoside hydrolase family protein [Nitrospirillum amazonense]
MIAFDPAQLEADLRRDEGVRAKAYYDTATPPRLTVGVGRNLTDKPLSAAWLRRLHIEKQTDLLRIPLSDDAIRDLLREDIASTVADMDQLLGSWWRALSEARQRGLINMAFNMGAPTLATFHTTLGHLQAGRFEQAAAAALASKWASQVGARAQRIAALFRQG